MTTGHRPRAKGYTVKYVDGKAVFVPEKPKFRKSIAQRKAARKVRKVVIGKRLI
jgi:hypothetical protein